MKFFKIYVLFFPFCFFVSRVTCDDYPARYQPELENIEIDSYINNPRLIDLETQCILYDGPCDIVGRFLKPRIARGLLGECILCTPKQAVTLQKLLNWVQTHRPDLYRLAIAKYLENNGVSLPPGQLATLEKLEQNEASNALGPTLPSII